MSARNVVGSDLSEGGGAIREWPGNVFVIQTAPLTVMGDNEMGQIKCPLIT